MARVAAGPWFRKSKNTWYATHQGEKISLKVRGEENEEEARRAWHRLMAGLPVEADAEKPADVKPRASLVKQTPDAFTLPELVKLFLADVEGRVKPASLRNYRTFLEPWAEATKKTAPDALTVPQVERYFKRPGWSQSYRCGFAGAVISLFRWAVDTGRLTKNPVQGLKKPPKQSRGRKAIISAENHAKLVEHAVGDFGQFLQLLWLTGCRPGELSGLTAADVDLPNQCIILAQHKTVEQTGRDRLIVLPDEAVSILRWLIAKHPEGLLFRGRNGRLTAQAIGRRLAWLCQKAGVKSCIAYGYRHTFATDALASGVPDTHVATLLGHQGTTMLHKHYAHLGARAQVLHQALDNIR